MRTFLTTLATAALLTVAVPLAEASPTPTSEAPTSTDVTRGPCAYTATPEDPAARPVKLPPDPRHTPSHGTAEVVLHTSQGLIPLTLTRPAAPCTVQSFLHLVRNKFYDDTICHRLTAYPTLKVLQCGDPTGTGERGPGYKYKDELPTTLQPAPTDPTGQRRIYPRGTLAMANAGPNTNGSQFFLVSADSVLRPNYTVFGRTNETGLATLDRIAAAGIAPTPDNPTPVDGAPTTPVTIHRAQRTC